MDKDSTLLQPQAWLSPTERESTKLWQLLSSPRQASGHSCILFSGSWTESFREWSAGFQSPASFPYCVPRLLPQDTS